MVWAGLEHATFSTKVKLSNHSAMVHRLWEMQNQINLCIHAVWWQPSLFTCSCYSLECLIFSSKYIKSVNTKYNKKNLWCRHSLEVPHQGTSYEYPKHIFWIDMWSKLFQNYHQILFLSKSSGATEEVTDGKKHYCFWWLSLFFFT